MDQGLRQHSLGFWELDPKPTPQALAQFYQNQYFNSANFERVYDADEYFHKQLSYVEAEFVFSEYLSLSEKHKHNQFKVLDIGCGEGFSLFYFQQKRWQVAGTDYSLDGVQRHFPDLARYVQTGDTEKILNEKIEKKEKYDLIILNNVLEHLLQPLEALKQLRQLVSENGVVRVQVPNDFSQLQLLALEKGFISKKFWIAPHEHMSYFNKESLINSFLHCGFSKTEALGDFPIDFNILNSDANYVQDKSKGKSCHRQRILIENMLAKKSPADLVSFRRGCGQAGLGRNVIVYGRP